MISAAILSPGRIQNFQAGTASATLSKKSAISVALAHQPLSVNSGANEIPAHLAAFIS